jgi:hypothetical protein
VSNRGVPYPAYYPTKFDRSGYQFNPMAGIPQPVPKVYTVPGLWVGAKIPIQNLFIAGSGNVVRQYRWSTPVFDLRPELRASTGSAPTNAVPLWRQLYGVGGRLWVQISGFNNNTFGKTGLQVTYEEFAHIVDENSIGRIMDPQESTSEFLGRAPTVALSFVPPGDGYPIRFWRMELKISYLQDNGADPNLVLQAAYY